MGRGSTVKASFEANATQTRQMIDQRWQKRRAAHGKGDNERARGGNGNGNGKDKGKGNGGGGGEDRE